uniref:Uncharacterized protein n=1 Tax=Panagrolaimus superbus TaxID=310955 RepID=A0A914Y757_9BILA
MNGELDNEEQKELGIFGNDRGDTFSAVDAVSRKIRGGDGSAYGKAMDYCARGKAMEAFDIKDDFGNCDDNGNIVMDIYDIKVGDAVNIVDIYTLEFLPDVIESPGPYDYRHEDICIGALGDLDVSTENDDAEIGVDVTQPGEEYEGSEPEVKDDIVGNICARAQQMAYDAKEAYHKVKDAVDTANDISRIFPY